MCWRAQRCGLLLEAIGAATLPSVRPGDRLGRRGPGGQLAAGLHAGNDQMEQVETELRILEVKLLESIIIDDGGPNVGLTADRLDAPPVRREQADFAQQG